MIKRRQLLHPTQRLYGLQDALMLFFVLSDTDPGLWGQNLYVLLRSDSEILN